MKIDLDGRRAIVTGGSSGIGRCIVEQLLAEGVAVSILDMQEPAATTAGGSLESAGPLFFPTNVADAEGVARAVAEAAESMGGLDIVVNNAGITRKGRVEEISSADWRSTFSVNVEGVMNVCQAAIPHLKESENGRIINAASFAAIVPSVGGAAYAASKNAVITLSRVLASELAPWAITVNSYAPGMIPTAMNGFAELDAEAASRKLAQVSLNRWGNTQDIAFLISYLSSDFARYITGSLIDISGGKIATQDPSAAW